MKVQAHRGASGYAPENTLPAFRLAVEMKADGIECDIHQTKDGAFLVCHDDTIQRTSTGQGAISQMTLEEIRKEDFGCKFDPKFSGTPAPTLEEMLDIVASMEVINIEIKEFGPDPDPALNRFYRILEKKQVLEQVLVSSFNPDILKHLKQLHPDITTAFLFGVPYPNDPVSFAKEHLCDGIHPEISTITPEMMEQAQNEGMFVNAWTVNDPDGVKKAKEFGCEGVITNYPDVALKALGRN